MSGLAYCNDHGSVPCPDCDAQTIAKDRHDELASERAAGRREEADVWLRSCKAILGTGHPMYSSILNEVINARR